MFTCSPKIVDYITYVLYLMINWRSFQITAQVKTILKTVHLISGVFAKTVGDTMGGFNFENNMRNTMEALNKKGRRSLTQPTGLNACYYKYYITPMFSDKSIVLRVQCYNPITCFCVILIITGLLTPCF